MGTRSVAIHFSSYPGWTLERKESSKVTQPPGSGQPKPVQGVTGGPGLPQGVASVDGSTGNVVISPPNNTVQFRKTDSPQALQIYEYFHSTIDFARVSINAQTGGPFELAVETEPPGVVRGLDISAGGSLFINTDNVIVNTSVQINGNLVVAGAPAASGIVQAVQLSSQYALLTGTQVTPLAGVVGLGNLTTPPAGGATNTLDWVISIGTANYRVRLYQ
jgi:hypothetical protein